MRRSVRDSIRKFFEGDIIETTKQNIKISFVKEPDDIMYSNINVLEKVEGKWVTRATFMPAKYFYGPWDMITTPWINDLVNDVVDAVIAIQK